MVQIARKMRGSFLMSFGFILRALPIKGNQILFVSLPKECSNMHLILFAVIYLRKNQDTCSEHPGLITSGVR